MSPALTTQPGILVALVAVVMGLAIMGALLVRLQQPTLIFGDLRERLPIPIAGRPGWVGPSIAVVLASVLWWGSVDGLDPREMNDHGLVSILPWPAFVALALITVSFVWTITSRPELTAVIAAHLLAFVAMLHATPAVAYEQLRYGWAWKHVGIVDYIQRKQALDTDIATLDIYHNWPSFFTLSALFNEMTGLPNAQEVASWGEFGFNLLFVGALLVLFRAMGADRRVMWTASWIFLLANWVGQDYFAPQAFAFFFYLVVLAILLRWYVQRGALPAMAGGEAITSPPTVAAAVSRGLTLPRTHTVVVGGAVLLAMLAIVSSHALTSYMMVAALGALWCLRLAPVGRFALAGALMTVLWALTFAQDYTQGNLADRASAIRLPWASAESGLVDTTELTTGQLLVTWSGRILVLAMVALAVIGMVRRRRAGQRDWTPAVLAVAPLAMFGIGDYDGEILFRLYMFATPFLAFLAASAIFARRGALRGKRGVIGAATVVVLLALQTGFLLAHYGKDSRYYFTPEEVAAADFIYTNAPPGSLLVEGILNYPGQFKNYEQFEYVPIAPQPRETHANLIANADDVFVDWLADPKYPAAFIIITRSQKAEVDALQRMPKGALAEIERKLLASPRYKVVLRNRDATIISLPGRDSLRGSE